jgi:hypothetical protein
VTLLIVIGGPVAGQAGQSGQATIVSPPNPVACRNLPVSSAVIEPVSCWVTGPTSMRIVGVEPGVSGTAVTVQVDGQHAQKVTGTAAALPTTVTTMPAPASSYYVFGASEAACTSTATTACPLYVDGADEPSPGGGALVVLDFGAPCFDPLISPPIYGTQLFNTTTCTPNAQLLTLAQAFYRGYESTRGASTPLGIIALGTSNSLNAVNTNHMLTAPQMRAAGTAWFTDVVQPFARTATAAAPIVTWAADDIEGTQANVDWYPPDLSAAWVDGYGTAASGVLGAKRCSGNDPYRMADYGDAPRTGAWTDAVYYQVAFGAPVACAVPEIYHTSMAADWQRVSQWGAANRGYPIAFTGPMSLGGEAGTLSWSDSWNALATATGQSPPYLTVIGSLFPSPPGAPSNVIALAGDTTATLWWSPPTTDGGSPVQDYTVTAIGTSGGPSTTVGGLPPPTTATVRGLTNGTAYTFVVTATNSAGAGTGSPQSNTVVPGPGRYHPVDPARILDTRNGVGGFTGPLGPQSQLTLPLASAGGLPSSGVAAVVMNVTATDTTASSYLTVFPSQVPRPVASNLNWSAGITVPNLVEVPVGPDGGVTVFNAAGSVDVIADIEGYVALANEPSGSDGLYAPVTPSRVLDTRDGTGTNGVRQPVGSAQTIAVPVASAGQEAVVLNLTATNPTAATYLTVWPDGTPQPVVSNLNVAAGQTIANRVMVKVPANGKVDIFNAAGSINVIADLNGSFTDGSSPASGTQFQGILPLRIVDSRNGTGSPAAPLGPGASRSFSVAGANGIPSTATAVVANLTVTNTSAASYLTAWPDGDTRPNASDLNWVARKTVPNLVVVKLGPNGKLDLFNAMGSTDVILDVVGYYR